MNFYLKVEVYILCTLCNEMCPVVRDFVVDVTTTKIITKSRTYSYKTFIQTTTKQFQISLVLFIEVVQSEDQTIHVLEDYLPKLI